MMWLGEKPVSIVTAWNILCEALWERMEFYGINKEKWRFGQVRQVPCKVKNNMNGIESMIPSMRQAIFHMLGNSFDPDNLGKWVDMPYEDSAQNDIDDPVYSSADIDRHAFFGKPGTVPSHRHTASEFIKAAAKLVNDKIRYPLPMRDLGNIPNLKGFYVDCDMHVYMYTDDSTKYGRFSEVGNIDMADNALLRTDLADHWKDKYRGKCYNHRWFYKPSSAIPGKAGCPLLRGVGKVRSTVSASCYRDGVNHVIFSENQEFDMDFAAGCATKEIDFSPASDMIEHVLDNNNWENKITAHITGNWGTDIMMLLNKENFPETNYKYME